jgi:hypothetical protein
MPRLTPADLDALEAAHKAATEGEWDTCLSSLTVEEEARIIEELAQFTGDHRRANVRLCALAHNALPALIAAARATVPEVIGEKHKKGDYWLVWDGDDWRKCRWNLQWKAWERSSGNMASHPGFTHALPLPPPPPMPEGPDA